MLWPVLLCVGLILGKLLMTWKGSVVPFPPTGEVHWYIEPSAAPAANLTLRAPKGAVANFAVRFDAWESKQPIAMIPVRDGEAATVAMPLGRYRMTIIKGTSWRGPDKLFGINSEAREAVEPVSFYQVGNSIVGRTIELETFAGNMETRPSTLGY